MLTWILGSYTVGTNTKSVCGNERKRAKGNTARGAARSVHLSPPLACLSRCLMVYYGKPKVEIQTGFETTAAVDFPQRSPVQIITRLSLCWPLRAHNRFVIIVS